MIQKKKQRKNLTGSDNNVLLLDSLGNRKKKNTLSSLLHQQQLLLLMKKQQQLSQFSSRSNHCPQPNNIESSLVTRRELSPPLMSRLVSAASNPNVSANVSVSSKEWVIYFFLVSDFLDIKKTISFSNF